MRLRNILEALPNNNLSFSDIFRERFTIKNKSIKAKKKKIHFDKVCKKFFTIYTSASIT